MRLLTGTVSILVYHEVSCIIIFPCGDFYE